MNLEQLNQLTEAECAKKFEQCCAAPKWYITLAQSAPFKSVECLLQKADTAWASCTENDFLAAFLGHPKIGNIQSLAEKFKASKQWAGNEQELVQEASLEIIEELAKGNRDYESKFGFIFIVFATGKTAEQMLQLLLERLPNERSKELLVAAHEQHKITRLRIQKLIA